MGYSKVIITAARGHWYPRGQARLLNSLVHHGWDGKIMAWNDIWPNSNYDTSAIYNIKAAALEEAINADHTHILWLDSSMWAIQHPRPIFESIDTQGIYVERNGFNAAQECSDACLDYFGISRDVAETIPMCSSGMLALNVNNPDGKQFAEMWIKAAKDGAFRGSRAHNNQSQDPRFLHHRQDQSAASIILHLLGRKPQPFGRFFAYYPANYGTKQTEQTIFFCQGL